MAAADDLSLNAWAVLCLLVDDGPQHGFALSRTLGRGSDIGLVWSVSRPLVYRALDQLERRGLAEAGESVPSPSGPPRQTYRATGTGATAADRWRAEPVERFRDVRPTLVLKLTLAHRAGLDLGPLLAAQRELFAPQVEEVRRPEPDPGSPTLVVDLWREQLALAVERTLAGLAEVDAGRRGRAQSG